MTDILTWLGIALCVSQSATFSGLNLAVFSVGRLRLQIEVARGNAAALQVLRLRRESNFVLATILWGNVGVNVLLTLLADSLLAGLSAFLFSTIVITILGEIVPQAYFSRNALRMASMLAPVLRFYQYLLYPVTRPTGWLLDRWLGPELVTYLSEDRLREMIRQHIRIGSGELDAVEGIGAMNFLSIDDIPVGHEGEVIDPATILQLPFHEGTPVFPEIRKDPNDPFLRQLGESGRAWVVITDPQGQPRSVVDSEGFLCGALFGRGEFDPHVYCHEPIVVEDNEIPLGQVIPHFEVSPVHYGDDVIHHDVILVWDKRQRRIITGSDILGRLLRGIVKLDWKG